MEQYLFCHFNSLQFIQSKSLSDNLKKDIKEDTSLEQYQVSFNSAQNCNQLSYL